jgi:pimeloyl-ACP methyl ester carboxylesterase
MAKQRIVPADHPAFAGLPVRMITADSGDQQIAVHVAGRLTSDRLPVVCVPGYQRNMSDFTEFVGYCQRAMGEDWPVVLLDLRGRGRSSDRTSKADYISPNDARDLSIVANALGIEAAVFIGQGYGGQVVMALGTERPSLIAGAVLVDAGPVSDPRGLVRLHRNLSQVEGMKGSGIRSMFRQMLSVSYPELPEARIDQLSARTHYLDKRERARALFDPHLITMLEEFEQDDVLVAQWPLFATLDNLPLLMFRTQLTDQLRREVFDEMLRRRDNAQGLMIAGQGSPALLDHPDETAAIAVFVKAINAARLAPATASAA